MKKFIKSIAVLTAFCATVAVFTAFNIGAAPAKINVCHMPPGNPENCQEISVSINALQAHLEHGDDLVCHQPEELHVYLQIRRDFVAAEPAGSMIDVITDF